MKNTAGIHYHIICSELQLKESAKQWKKDLQYFDIKWVLIFGIAAFLIVFQVFPLIYLVIRALFGTGHFSLEGVKRIYTYALNWSCLRNTLVTAALSMIFGVLIAFPLAWLVGRTNLYGRAFFRTLFVTTYMVPPYVGAMAWLRLLNPTVGTPQRRAVETDKRKVFDLTVCSDFSIWRQQGQRPRTCGGLVCRRGKGAPYAGHYT